MVALVKNVQAEVSAQEEPCPVPDEMLGHLYRSNEARVAAMVGTLAAPQRAHLAIFCYHRGHLRDLGLMIARTCDLQTLVEVAGTAGSVLFDQSRQNAFAMTERRPVSGRGRVSLAIRTVH